MWSIQHNSISDSGDNRVPIYLNVYDVSPINGYLYWLGLGIFHSGVEVHGVEYAFGAHDFPTSGVYEVEPRNCPGFIYRRTIPIGTTDKNPVQIRELMEQISLDYTGDSYHLLVKNCNHFTDEVCTRLTKRSAPGWINRLARIATFCNCLLPEGLQVSSVGDVPHYGYEDEDMEDLSSNQANIYSQSQHLLTTPNGNVQSHLQDHFRDANGKRMATNV